MKELNEQNILSFIKEAEDIFLPDEQHFEDQIRNFIKCLDSVDVNACPGSGKTTALLAKLYILSKFMPFGQNKGICVLTHTNVAINEIKQKGDKVGSILFTYPNFFGTIQSFVDKFLAIPAYIYLYGSRDLIIDNDMYESSFCRRVKEVSKKDKKFWENGYIYNLLSSEQKALEFKEQIFYKYAIMLGFHPIWERNNNSNALIFKNYAKEKVLRNPSSNAYNFIKNLIYNIVKNGIIRYEDAYALGKFYIDCFIHKDNNAFTQRFKFVFIDEMQDTDQTQIDLLNKLFSSGTIIQRIGDPNQAIFDNYNTESEVLCSQSDKQIHIPYSKRFSNQIAKVIQNVCIKPEKDLQGMNRGTDDSLKPILILYDESTISSVLQKFCVLIKKRENNWKLEIDKPIYYAVGWTHDIKKTTGWTHDIKKTTTKGQEKICIKSYFDGYHKPQKVENSRYNSLKNYLIKPPNSNDISEAKIIYDSLIAAFLRVLNIIEVYLTDSKRSYTKRSLLEHISNDENFYNDFKENLAKWVKLIQEHNDSCAKYNCQYRKLPYPNCVLEEMSKYITEKWIPYFSYQAEIWEQKINHFLTRDIEDIKNNTSIRNIYTYDGINVQVGTVHSVKGQTHTATLFLECFQQDFYGKQLIDYLVANDKIYSDTDGKYKKDALKIAYVAMSRPTHFLCAAFHKDRIPEEYRQALKNRGWVIVF